MRRWFLLLGLCFAVLALVACGGGDDDDGDSGGGDDGGSASQDSDGGGATAEPVDTDELSYLTLTPLGLSRIAAESGDETTLATWEDLGLPFGETLTLPRLYDGLLWGALGPGHIIAIDPESGDVERDLMFDSTQIVTDFGFANGLLWVQAGIAYADAVLLGVDDSSGDLVYTIEPPAGATIGGMAAGDEGVWLLGGDPETASAFSRVDPGSGSVTGTFDAGLVVKAIAVGEGSVWVGGNQYQFEGKEGDAVVRFDPETAEELARIEVDSLYSILDYNGAIWLSSPASQDFASAQLHRVDPATNEITATIDVGEATTGAVSLIAGDGYIFAINSQDRVTYVINAATAEGEARISGPYAPIAIR
jgi:hypothetical protein